jgi:hypothetical protein
MFDGFDFTPDCSLGISTSQVVPTLQAGYTNRTILARRMDNDSLEATIRSIITEIQAMSEANPHNGRIGKTQNKLFKVIDDNKSFFGIYPNSPTHIHDAWQNTCTHFYEHLLEAKGSTESPYCDARKSIIGRIKTYLKGRILDEEMKQQNKKRLTVKKTDSPTDQSPNTLTDQSPDLSDDPKKKRVYQTVFISIDAPVNGDGSQTVGDSLPANNVKDYEWLYKVIHESDELKKTTMKKYPHVNCQLIAMLYLKFGQNAKVAKELNIPEKAFTAFFNRTYKPLMKKLCEASPQFPGL